MQLGFILSLLFAIFVTVFALQNSTAVSINFLFANVEISQALVIFISAVAGAIIFAILGFYRELKIRNNLKKANKQVKQLEADKTKLNEKIDELNSKINELTPSEDLTVEESQVDLPTENLNNNEKKDNK